ncbi:hypothetical protein GQ42DRAFT_51012 [Ramicandelaber brevisporus]|nr:hypothetical protein GQ42DRAFT_51012 [Ramicandelaber brevisporus]
MATVTTSTTVTSSSSSINSSDSRATVQSTSARPLRAVTEDEREQLFQRVKMVISRSVNTELKDSSEEDVSSIRDQFANIVVSALVDIYNESTVHQQLSDISVPVFIGEYWSKLSIAQLVLDNILSQEETSSLRVWLAIEVYLDAFKDTKNKIADQANVSKKTASYSPSTATTSNTATVPAQAITAAASPASVQLVSKQQSQPKFNNSTLFAGLVSPSPNDSSTPIVSDKRSKHKRRLDSSDEHQSTKRHQQSPPSAPPPPPPLPLLSLTQNTPATSSTAAIPVQTTQMLSTLPAALPTSRSSLPSTTTSLTPRSNVLPDIQEELDARENESMQQVIAVRQQLNSISPNAGSSWLLASLNSLKIQLRSKIVECHARPIVNFK